MLKYLVLLRPDAKRLMKIMEPNPYETFKATFCGVRVLKH